MPLRVKLVGVVAVVTDTEPSIESPKMARRRPARPATGDVMLACVKPRALK